MLDLRLGLTDACRISRDTKDPRCLQDRSLSIFLVFRVVCVQKYRARCLLDPFLGWRLTVRSKGKLLIPRSVSARWLTLRRTRRVRRPKRRAHLQHAHLHTHNAPPVQALLLVETEVLLVLRRGHNQVLHRQEVAQLKSHHGLHLSNTARLNATLGFRKKTTRSSKMWTRRSLLL